MLLDRQQLQQRRIVFAVTQQVVETAAVREPARRDYRIAQQQRVRAHGSRIISGVAQLGIAGNRRQVRGEMTAGRKPDGRHAPGIHMPFVGMLANHRHRFGHLQQRHRVPAWHAGVFQYERLIAGREELQRDRFGFTVGSDSVPAAGNDQDRRPAPVRVHLRAVVDHIADEFGLRAVDAVDDLGEMLHGLPFLSPLGLARARIRRVLYQHDTRTIRGCDLCGFANRATVTAVSKPHGIRRIGSPDASHAVFRCRRRSGR